MRADRWAEACGKCGQARRVVTDCEACSKWLVEVENEECKLVLEERIKARGRVGVDRRRDQD